MAGSPSPEVQREHSLVQRYWSAECDRWLADLIQSEGSFYIWRVRELFEQTIGKAAWEAFSLQAEELRTAGITQYVHYNLPMNFARHLVESRGWLVPELPVLACRLCEKKFPLESHRPSTIATISVKTMSEIPFCPACYDAALLGCLSLPSTREGRRSALARIVVLTAALGFVPPQDFRNRAVLSRLPKERILPVLVSLKDMPSPGYYSRHWRHWLTALVAAGVLDEEARPTGRGTQCLAADGHPCLSIAEKAIDDWLSARGIPHEKEPAYPVHSLYNPTGQRRADWLVREYYVELFGLLGDLEYDRRANEKRILARALGLKVIELTYNDIPDPAAKLSFLVEVR